MTKKDTSFSIIKIEKYSVSAESEKEKDDFDSGKGYRFISFTCSDGSVITFAELHKQRGDYEIFDAESDIGNINGSNEAINLLEYVNQFPHTYEGVKDLQK